MAKKESSNHVIKFKLHLILFFITGTLWGAFYNLFCFIGLNKLTPIKASEKISPPKNSAIINFLIYCTFFGAPFALFKRFQLLRNYVNSVEPLLKPLPKMKNKAGEEVEQKYPNCLEPGKFVGYAIATFFLICIAALSFTFFILYMIQEIIPYVIINDAYMIFLPIGIATFLAAFAFSMRTIKEEQKWVDSYNRFALLKTEDFK